jgi:hypothetical protein
MLNHPPEDVKWERERERLLIKAQYHVTFGLFAAHNIMGRHRQLSTAHGQRSGARLKLVSPAFRTTRVHGGGTCRHSSFELENESLQSSLCGHVQGANRFSQPSSAHIPNRGFVGHKTTKLSFLYFGPEVALPPNDFHFSSSLPQRPPSSPSPLQSPHAWPPLPPAMVTPRVLKLSLLRRLRAIGLPPQWRTRSVSLSLSRSPLSVPAGASRCLAVRQVFARTTQRATGVPRL